MAATRRSRKARKLPAAQIATVLGTVLIAIAPATAETHYVAVDVPTALGGAYYMPEQIVRRVDAVYAVEAQLPLGAAISALHRRPDGTWLVAFAHAVTLGGATYEPRDVLAYNGVDFTPFLLGSATGVPHDGRIDALFLDGGGRVVLSFDVPIRLGDRDYGPSDLVRYDSGFALHWDAQASGVPRGSNLCGAATTATGALILTFDVPTLLGGVDFLPGQLVRWENSAFTIYQVDPSWPLGSRLGDFSFLPSAGAVPEANAQGTPLTVDKAPGGDITLAWGVSCVGTDSDYEVYEGALGGTFSGHTPRSCSVGGATSHTLTPPAGSAYYLIVPRNGVAEGSYGLRSDGYERAQSASACLPRVTSGPCD